MIWWQSPTPPLPHHRHERHDADSESHEKRGDSQVPFDLLLERRDHANHWRGDADDGFGGVVEVDWEAHWQCVGVNVRVGRRDRAGCRGGGISQPTPCSGR